MRAELRQHRILMPLNELDDLSTQSLLAGADVVIARAVAPLARLWAWSAPLLRQGGRLVALKGESAAEEVARDGGAVTRTGGSDPVVERCGADLLAVPTTIIVVTRLSPPQSARGRGPRRTKK